MVKKVFYPVAQAERALEIASRQGLELRQFAAAAKLTVNEVARLIAYGELALELVTRENNDTMYDIAVIVPGGKHDIPFDGRP